MADGSGKKGKKCGKGYVSAKKKCKANFRQAASSQPPLAPKKEEPKKEEAKKGMSALAIASAIGLGAVGIGAAGLGIAALSRGSGSSGEGRGAGSVLGRERQGAKGWGHPRSFGKTGWVAPGNLSRSEVERILTPIEEGIREKDREWVAVVDGKTGQILTPPTGGTHTGQVELPDTAMKGNAIITHNHPDVPWVDGSRSDGGPLSPGDVEAALTFRAEIRAVSSKGTYSLRVDWSKMEDWEARAARGEDPDGLTDVMLSQYKRVPRRHEEILAEAAQRIRDDLLAGRPVPSPHEIGHKALLDLAEEFKSLSLIYEAKERRFTADSASPRISSLGTTQACAQIRADAKKTVVNKGKKCPGGYWIPKKNECGGKKLSLPGGDDARQKNRRNLAVGLGLGLGGAALVGVGITAAASRKGNTGEDQGIYKGRQEGGRVDPEVSPVRGNENNPDPKVVDSIIESRRKIFSEKAAGEPFDETQQRRLAELEARDDEDVLEISFAIHGMESDLPRAIENLRKKGVDNAVRQMSASYIETLEAELKERESRDPSTDLGLGRQRMKDIRQELGVYRNIIELTGRKDSSFLYPHRSGAMIWN